jgi:excisionase family DNA binding protein
MSDDLLTVLEVAGLLRMKPKGVYGMVAARRIPFVRVSNRIRFLRSDLDRWLSTNRHSPVEEG